MIRLFTTTALAATALGAFGLAGCASTGTMEEAKAPAPPPPYVAPTTLDEATAGASDVALYRVGDDDTTVYLMGTVHILRPDTAWKTPAFEAAFAEATAIYVEADTSPEVAAELQPIVMERGLNPAGTTLMDYFEPEQAAALETALAGVGVPIANLAPLRPWLASVTLGVVGIQAVGGDPEAGVEKILEADAKAAGKPVRALETARSQIEALASVPDDVMAASMVADLDSYSDFEGYYAKLIGAWYDGRMDVVGDVINESLGVSPEIADALLYKRNANWADQLAELIETEDGTFLVAVGAGHLAGDKSVQDYLAERGYETTRN